MVLEVGMVSSGGNNCGIWNRRRQNINKKWNGSRKIRNKK